MKIAIIFSHWKLQKIINFLKDYLDAQDWEIGTTNVERYVKNNEIKDSNKTLILMKESLFERAMEAGLNMRQPNLDFLMFEFVLTNKYLPSVNYSPHFYIKIPETLSPSDIEILIQEKMNVFIIFKLITSDDYSIFIPLKSRITGQHRNFAILKFNENVDICIRAYIKALIHNSVLYFTGENFQYLSVFWLKNKT